MNTLTKLCFLPVVTSVCLAVVGMQVVETVLKGGE